MNVTTYAQAHDMIMNGLERDGWTLKRNLKVPQAISPDGQNKLWFKAQAIYRSWGNQDLGGARSLHLPDVRTMSYEQFKKALEPWLERGQQMPRMGNSRDSKKVTLPTFLGPALINGDVSGLVEEDNKWLEAALELAGDGHYVDMSDDSHFAWRNDLVGFNLGAEVAEFTILY